MKKVMVSGSFDDLRSNHVRFLQEAARLGEVHVALWSDEMVRQMEGHSPKFPLEERQYLVEAIRFVQGVVRVEQASQAEAAPALDGRQPEVWAVDEAHDTPQKRAFCEAQGMDYHIIRAQELQGFPLPPPQPLSGRKKVIVTGCYDWLHSGHIRFFEEVSTLGDLYVAVGNDANVTHLKGEGHPLFSQDLRRYMAGAVRFVSQSLITSGWGWMDAEPDIAVIQPEIYAVNEDGDKPEKRAFCQEHGLEYVVLKRLPKAGLPRRQSTDLRGF